MELKQDQIIKQAIECYYRNGLCPKNVMCSDCFMRDILKEYRCNPSLAFEKAKEIAGEGGNR